MNLNKKEHSMSQTIRKIAAIVGGIAVGRIVLALVAMICSMLFRPSQTFTSSNQEPANSSLTYISVLLGWLFASFYGAYTGIVFARSSRVAVACIIGGIFLVVAVTNMIISPFPLWIGVASIIIIISGTYSGYVKAPNASAQNKQVAAG